MSAVREYGRKHASQIVMQSEVKFKHGRLQASHLAGQVLVTATRNGIWKGDKKGRVYSHPTRKGTYQASAPRQYSANVTGKVLKGISYKVQGVHRLVHGIDAPYAEYLEKGTSKMKPRPNLLNAMNDSIGKLFKIFGYIPYSKMSK